VTTQFPDKAIYFGTEGWNLVIPEREERSEDCGNPIVHPDDIFKPAHYGLRPVGICSACWKGYRFHVSIDQNGLVLDTLALSQDEGTPLARINGVAPSEFSSYSDIRYSNVKLKLPVSGILRIGRDIDEDMPRPMYGIPSYLYRCVFEVELNDGNLIAMVNRSAKYEKFRSDNRQRLEDGNRNFYALFD